MWYGAATALPESRAFELNPYDALYVPRGSACRLVKRANWQDHALEFIRCIAGERCWVGNRKKEFMAGAAIAT